MATLKRIISAFFIFLTLTACGGGEYGDLKDLMSAQAKVMENYIEAMSKVESPEDVVVAMNNFTLEMKGLIPEMKKTLKKYPELSNIQAPPEPLKAQAEEMRVLSSKLQAATMKTMQFMNDPEVQKAMQKQSEVMMALTKE